MADLIERPNTRLAEVASVDAPRVLNNLLDYIEQRKSAVSHGERGRGVTEEFQQDLQFAATRSVEWLERTTAKARAKEAVFWALDGLTGSERRPNVQIDLLELLGGLTEEPSSLRFEPATHGQIGQGTTLEETCACAVASDGSVAYVSTDLGFRELFVVAQSALLQTLVIRGQEMGLDIKAPDAIRAFRSLPDSGIGAAPDLAEVRSTLIKINDKTIPGFVTSSHLRLTPG